MSDSKYTLTRQRLEKLLSMDEASSILGISKTALFGLMCQRKINVMKVGSTRMFKTSDILKFIESNAAEPIKAG